MISYLCSSCMFKAAGECRHIRQIMTAYYHIANDVANQELIKISYDVNINNELLELCDTIPW